jgi:predicted nucleic acid-binding protein
MERLGARLNQHAIVGLDSAIFIYHIEAHPLYLPLTRIVLQSLQAGAYRGVASVLALMELTVRPWQLKQAAAAREYEALLVHFPNLTMIDVNRSISRRAAQLRASQNIRAVDALHVATALQSKATAFVTNDRDLRRLAPLLDVIVLDEFLPPQ